MNLPEHQTITHIIVVFLAVQEHGLLNEDDSEGSSEEDDSEEDSEDDSENDD